MSDAITMRAQGIEFNTRKLPLFSRRSFVHRSCFIQLFSTQVAIYMYAFVMNRNGLKIDRKCEHEKNVGPCYSIDVDVQGSSGKIFLHKSMEFQDEEGSRDRERRNFFIGRISISENFLPLDFYLKISLIIFPAFHVDSSSSSDFRLHLLLLLLPRNDLCACELPNFILLLLCCSYTTIITLCERERMC